MKVVAFNGSPKKAGNTFQAIRMVAAELEKKGIEVEIVHVGNQPIPGCMACNMCAKNGDDKCVIIKDEVNLWIAKMKEADGIIFGSPVYFAGINGTLKAFLDRAGYVLGRRPGTLRYKVGTAVVTVRRTGGIAALDTLNHYINYFEMLAPASNYWNVIHGKAPGDVVHDEEGEQIMRVLGRNMAWLMQVVELGRKVVELPEQEAKVMTNFIR